ncbi:MAG: HAD family hydrolase [Chlorobi bacterium]|nr:HAD family hydrolase [Chlorobiota bacterium]
METDKKKAVFFDRDGVINVENGDYTWKIEDVAINEGIVESLLKFQENGFLLIIVSNQGGIAKGLYSKNDVDKVHEYLTVLLQEQNINIAQIYYCPHHSIVENCICRKPDSLMLEKALARYNINPKTSYLFGDKESDTTAAKKVGVKGILIKSNENILPYCNKIINKEI